MLRKRTSLILAVILLLPLLAGAYEFNLTWHKGAGLSVMNEPVVAEVNGDNIYDIVISDIKGKVAVISANTGQPLWKKQLKGIKITDPAVGHFWPDETLDLAVGGSDGNLYVLNGGSGEVRWRHSVGNAIVLAPTAVALSQDTAALDGIIVIDEKGGVHFLKPEAQPNGVSVKEVWRLDTGSGITVPVSVGYITQNEVKEAVVATQSGELWIIGLEPGGRQFKFTHFARRAITNIPAVGDIAGDRRDEVVFADSDGNLNALEFERGELKLRWGEVAAALRGRKLTDPALSDIDHDGKKEILLGCSQFIRCFDGDKGQKLWDKGITPLGNIVTNLTLIETTTDRIFLLFGTELRNLHLIDARQGSEAKIFTMDKGLSSLTTPVFDTDGDGFAEVLVATDSPQELNLFSTDINCAADALVWQTRGGNQQHSCLIDPIYLQRLSQYRRLSHYRLNELLGLAQQAINQENWAEASRLLDRVLDINGRHRKARTLSYWVWLRSHVPQVAGVSFVSLAIISIALYFLISRLKKRRALRRAEALINANNLAPAIDILGPLARRYANDNQITLTLARVLVKMGAFSPEHQKIFEQALQLQPSDKLFLKALASCYLQGGRDDDKALDAYLQAYDQFEDRSNLAFTIGKIYHRGSNYQRAAKFFRDALRQGLRKDEVYDILVDTYMKMDFYHPKAIPVFEQVFPRRRKDPTFVKALCNVYRAAKLVERGAQEIYLLALKYDAEYYPALIQMAKAKWQEGDSESAESYAFRVLDQQPQDPEALFVLGQCFQLRGRKDAAAINVYEQYLRHFPDAPDTLRTLAHIYFDQQRFDQQAQEIYKQTIKHHPRDVSTLLALAKAARKSKDDALAIEAIEALIELGTSEDGHYVQLANAYRRKRVIAPKAIKAYTRALKANPRDKELLLLLGECLVSANRTDINAIKIFEAIIADHPERFSIGQHLVKSYLKTSEYDKCQQLARSLLRRFPDNMDLQHSLAQAVLHQDKLDEAIRHYKEILRYRPDDERALYNLAQAYAHQRRTDPKAEQVYRQALEFYPQDGMLHLAMAKVYGDKTQFDLVIPELQKAIDVNPEIAKTVLDDALEMLAENPGQTGLRWFVCRLLIENERLREAIDQVETIFQDSPEDLEAVLNTYDKIIAIDPRNALALQKKGVLLKVKGQFEEARQALEAAFELQASEPELQQELTQLYEMMLSEREDTEIRFKLGNVYYVAGDFEQAVACFQNTARNFRWESDSIKMLGRTFMAKGMLDLALQEFRRLTVDDELKELLYELAQRFEAKKDLVGAKTVYRHLFAADIDYRDVKEKFEMFAGSTSDPIVFQKTTIIESLSDKAKRRYELLEEVGRGAMGIVYKARDNELDEIVALKILPDNLSNNPDAVGRFRQEARSARRLSHPNIVRIHDIGEEMGRKYISMEFVEGVDVKRLMKTQGRLDLETVVSVARQVASALDYAHKIGIIHRDIKPANIMLTRDGKVKITDFGIAKVMESTEVTLAGSVLGTPLYMAPEQVQGTPVDHRSDIYALGIVLYEIVKGYPPFYEGDLAYQHLHVEPKPLTDVPKGINDIILRCLKKDKDERWQSAEALLQALTSFDI